MTNGWKGTTINEVCDITSTKRIYRADYEAEGVPFYRGKEIIEKQRGVLDVSTALFISEEKFQAIEEKFGAPHPGDLLLTSVGTLGVPYIVQPGERFYFKDGNLTWFRNLRNIYSRFLYYWLLSPMGKAQLGRSTIGSSQPALTIVLLKQMEIDLPDFPAQHKIASILSAYDDLIKNNLRRIKILEEIAQALYREWFVKFRFPGHEKARMVDSPLGKIPEGWEVKKLGDVIELAYGKGLKKTDRIEGNVPVYGSSGVLGYHITRLVNGPGIIVGRKGNVGSVHWSNSDFFPIDTVFYVKTKLSLYYVFYNFQTQNFINTDAAVPGLSRNQAYLLPFLVPPYSILKQFEEMIKPFFALGIKMKDKIEVLKHTRDLLLPKLISGELDVSDLDIKTGGHMQ
jgi:type I restriction enzyme S subunit